MEFAIYSRKSKQTGKGESIENQILICKKYIEARFGTKHQIHIFSEEGVSAKNKERPQFQNMLLWAQQKKLDYIVCYRLDRISRNVGDFAQLVEQLSKWNIAFICVQEQFDTATPTGRAMMYMASVFAQLERETIAERVKDNMMHLAKKGYWLGGTPPLGFVSKRAVEKEHSFCYLEQNEFEMMTAKKIYMLFLEYCSVSAVKRKLEEEKIFSRQNKPFSLIGIKEILSNPVYCHADEQAREYFLKQKATVTFSKEECSDIYGLLAYNKRNYAKKSAPRQKIEHWIVAKGKQKAIVTGKQWIAVQNILQRNKPNTQQQKTENEYALLSGILYCQKCGSKMQAKKRRNQQKGIVFDYICKAKLQKKCTMQNLSGNQTDEKTEKLLLQYISEKNCFDEIYKKYQNNTFSQEIKQCQKGILHCQRQKENYIALLGEQKANDILIKEVNQKLMQLQNQQNMLQKTKTLLQQNQWLQTDTISFFSLWKELSIKQKQEAIRFLIKKGIWTGEEVWYYL